MDNSRSKEKRGRRETKEKWGEESSYLAFRKNTRTYIRERKYARINVDFTLPKKENPRIISEKVLLPSACVNFHPNSVDIRKDYFAGNTFNLKFTQFSFMYT